MAELSKPVPDVTPQLAPFFEAARRGVLAVQKCDSCGRLRFPPRELCSHCLSTGASWIPVSGRGEVFSFNIMHQVYHPAFAAQVPYAVVVVQLEEGARMISNLVGVKPHEIRCGMPVEVMFEKPLNEEVTLPKFRPRASS
ncbi:MAG: Zn-ribbon domain-containing OB-fold protein [Candidatus Binataceae bacterium]